MGFIINNLGPLFYLLEINLVSGSYAAIFSQLVPIYSVILFYAFKVEDINRIRSKKAIFQIIGILIGCISAMSIVIYQFKGFDKSKPIMNLIITTILGLVDNLLFAFQYVCQWKLFYNKPDSILKNRPLTTQAYFLSFGSLLYCVFFGPYIFWNYKEIGIIFTKALIPILYSSVIMAPISYGLLSYCNKKTSPILVGSSCSLSVVCTLLSLRMFSTERLENVQYVLFFGVVAGVFMVILSPIFDEDPPQI